MCAAAVSSRLAGCASLLSTRDDEAKDLVQIWG
jgi:hypothetical protein